MIGTLACYSASNENFKFVQRDMYMHTHWHIQIHTHIYKCAIAQMEPPPPIKWDRE